MSCLRHRLPFKFVPLEFSFHVGGPISVRFAPSLIKKTWKRCSFVIEIFERPDGVISFAGDVRATLRWIGTGKDRRGTHMLLVADFEA